MNITLHQTKHTIGDFEEIFNSLKQDIENATSRNTIVEIHVYPELSLTGYPLLDLVLQKEFIDKYLKFFNLLNDYFNSLDSNENIIFLLGVLKYTLDRNNLPLKIENCIFKVSPGLKLQHVYSKILLPTYDIFDEKKYFYPGSIPKILNIKGYFIGLLICEDMWFSSNHEVDPVKLLINHVSKKKINLDAVLNLSASPYFTNKQDTRIERAKEISSELQAPFIYVNRVGAEDEILFDGRSFVIRNNKIDFMLKSFEEDSRTLKLYRDKNLQVEKKRKSTLTNTWDSLFAPSLEKINGRLLICKLRDKDCEEILEALIFGFNEYGRKTNLNKYLIAMSGGIDSAIVLAIAYLSKRPIEAIYMPSIYSSDISTRLSKEMCKNINIELKTLPIDDIYQTIHKSFRIHINTKLEGLADENIQSRIRGALIYARSNQTGAMVINTSNKSELSVGYSTLYGDSVGAISLIGDLYKTEVYTLAKYINKKFNNIIPNEIITRGPSAELRHNQLDSDSLPPYETLDTILEGILSFRFSRLDLEQSGINKEEIEKVYGKYVKTEYKRKQFCPILKVKAKSFGFGYRVPITKKI